MQELVKNMFLLHRTVNITFKWVSIRHKIDEITFIEKLESNSYELQDDGEFV